jgi:hypothetical protein
MSRFLTISTFLGYYKVTSAGMINIISRPAVEVPSIKVSKGSSTPVNIATLVASINAIVEDNSLIPVVAINGDIETMLTAILTDSQADAVSNGGANSIKFGLIVPEAGPNKDNGVLIVTSKVSGTKTVLEIPIEASGE